MQSLTWIFENGLGYDFSCNLPCFVHSLHNREPHTPRGLLTFRAASSTLEAILPIRKPNRTGYGRYRARSLDPRGCIRTKTIDYDRIYRRDA